MKICIVTPAAPDSLKGNRVTADRWARLLGELGHEVRIVEQWQGEATDLLLALHARKSFDSIQAFHREPGGSLVLALTGTDVYSDIGRNSQARRALDLAWRLVLLQPAAIDRLPEEVKPKARIIRQSVRVPEELRSATPADETFDVVLLAHLRPVKDPFRIADAARMLPKSSRIRVLHAGGPLSPDMERQAREWEDRTSRYHWLGAMPRLNALALLGRSRVMVLTSKLEGGANVVSEALALDVPILSSRIEGSEGILGEDYPGYFPVGDSRALADLLHRVETDETFYEELRGRCRDLEPLTRPELEKEAWRRLLEELKA